jgi:hypothetical protein
MGRKKRYVKKPPDPARSGHCEICGAKAFHGFSNRGRYGKMFCPEHLAEGEAYWRKVNEID